MFVSMLSKLPPVVCLRGEGATGLLNEGGGSNRLPVEFPQVQTSNYECDIGGWCTLNRTPLFCLTV